MMGLQILKTDLQGSVVVFGACSWTDAYEEYVTDKENKNYCAIIKRVENFQINDCSDLLQLLGPDPLPAGPHLLLRVPAVSLLEINLEFKQT